MPARGGRAGHSEPAGKPGPHNVREVSTPDPARRRKHKTDPPPLSAREVRFCQLWVETANATRSYIDAGFPHGSENSAKVMALRLLRKVTVREYIRELQRHAAAAAKVTVEQIIAGIAAIATYDRRKLYDEHGCILLPHQWPDTEAAAVVSAKSHELFEPVPGEKGKKRLKGHAVEVKTADKLAAWSKLAEIVGAAAKKEGSAAAGNTLVVIQGPTAVPPPAAEPDEPEETPG